MEERAVVDRIEDGNLAVLLVGEDEVECVLPLSELPTGTESGSLLRVEFDDDQLVHAVLDEASRAEVQRRVEDKMQRLRRRGRKL